MRRYTAWLLLLVAMLLLPTACQFRAELVINGLQVRDYWPTSGWRSLPPETQGMNSSLLNEFWNHIYLTGGVQGFLVIRNGYLLFEAYGQDLGPTQVWRIYSGTKSVTGALLGIAIAEGYVTSVNDPVLDYFPNHSFENPDPRKEAMALWHLLTMSSGLERSDFGMGASSDWVQYLLDSPMTDEPGERWNYNGGCSHLLSAILSETTGQSMATIAQTRLFTPMGISNFEWAADPQGITMGFSGLCLTLRDLAKIGYLFLNNGTWGASHLLPAEWVAQCVYPHFIFGNGEGYGYQWWVDPEVSGYSIRGAGGMRVFILPREDLILVFASALDYSSFEYYAFFDQFLYPAIIGDPVSIPSSLWELMLPLFVGIMIVVIPIVSGIVYWKRNTRDRL